MKYLKALFSCIDWQCLTLFLPALGRISPLILYHVTTPSKNRGRLLLKLRPICKIIFTVLDYLLFQFGLRDSRDMGLVINKRSCCISFFWPGFTIQCQANLMILYSLINRRQLHIFFYQANTWRMIVCWFSWISLFLPEFTHGLLPWFTLIYLVWTKNCFVNKTKQF